MSPPLRDSLAEIVRAAGATVAAGDPPDDTRLLLDSLAYFDLALLLDERLGLRVPPEDLTPAHFATFGSLLAYVEGRRGSGERADPASAALP